MCRLTATFKSLRAAMADHSSPLPDSRPRPGAIRRWGPAAALVVLVAVAFGLDLHHHLSLAALAENRDVLKAYVATHLIEAILIYMALYVAATALSIPVGAVLSITGGFLFGWVISAPVTVVAAVAGAAIVFEIVRTSFGAALAERAGPLVQKLQRGFAENAFSLLLFLRLAPVFPFCAVNAVSGLCRVPLRTFVLATLIGIIPASIAFALIGSGLDRVIDLQLAVYRDCVAANGPAACRIAIEPSALITRELLFGFGGLGLVALLPLAARWWKGHFAKDKSPCQELDKRG
jgi:uncharacterized membrane protein YdjX (TVP38/TMEM64 family)